MLIHCTLRNKGFDERIINKKAASGILFLFMVLTTAGVNSFAEKVIITKDLYEALCWRSVFIKG